MSGRTKTEIINSYEERLKTLSERLADTSNYYQEELRRNTQQIRDLSAKLREAERGVENLRLKLSVYNDFANATARADRLVMNL